jgi:hypothetical protein
MWELRSFGQATVTIKVLHNRTELTAVFSNAPRALGVEWDEGISSTHKETIMNPPIDLPVVLDPSPKADTALPAADPQTDPLREGQEIIEAIRADCSAAPEEYLDEIRVLGGGE